MFHTLLPPHFSSLPPSNHPRIFIPQPRPCMPLDGWLWYGKVGSLALAADLHFEFGDAPLEAEQLLLEGGLFALEGSDLLLDAAVLGLLEVEMSLPNSEHPYISSSMRTSSLERLFLTSAVFMVSTDSRVSFSLRRICTSFLWLLSSLEMFLIWFCLRGWVPRGSAACP